MVMTAETKKKISAALKGKKNRLGTHQSEEWKKRQGIKMMGNQFALGNKHSDEWKQQASERMKDNKYNPGGEVSDEVRARLLSYAKGNKVNLGRKASEETRIKLSDTHKGERSWHWKLGLRSKPYGVDWTATLRRTIRERDNYTCQLCGKRQEDKAFDVHHIDFDKANNKPENLITLCCDCHRKTLHCSNRTRWINFFGSTIRYRKVA